MESPQQVAWLKYVPESILPYIYLSRLHYFNGPNLFYWPYAYGLILGHILTPASPLSLVKQNALSFLGSLVLHSAGSTWNDICDRELDAKVERTKNRPLVKGTVSLGYALIFVVPQLIILAFLLRLNNDLSFYLGSFSLFVLVPLYPLMKRVTYWPQAWLGIITASSVLVASSSVTNTLELPIAGSMFVGIVSWCIYYDTIYGMMDVKDDIPAGINSTAVLFGSWARPILSSFAAIFVGSLIIVGWGLDASSMYYVCAVGGTSIHLFWQLVAVDFNNKKSCFSIFSSNGTQTGYLPFIGLLIQYYKIA